MLKFQFGVESFECVSVVGPFSEHNVLGKSYTAGHTGRFPITFFALHVFSR